MQFLTTIEVRRFETDGTQKQVDPFVGGELVAARPVLFQVECGKLDRSQAVDPEWAALALLLFVKDALKILRTGSPNTLLELSS
jgi:hypothetical protein